MKPMVKIRLKTRPPRFDGDKSSNSLQVTGDARHFNPKVSRLLELHGLVHMFEDGAGDDVWGIPYNTGPAPLYVAVLLEKLYDFQPDPNVSGLLKAAVGPFEDDTADSLDHFIGRSKSASGGPLPLTIISGKREFVANCDDENWARRAFLEGAGWIPVRNPKAALVKVLGSRPYMTRDPFVADNLQSYMKAEARLLLKAMVQKAARNLKRSSSQDAPSDFAIPAPEGLDYLPFQKGGVAQAIETYRETGGGSLIADDMGLGKTVQGIGVLNGCQEVRRCVVFCQANMRLKWVREIEKWKINTDLTVGHAEGSSFPDTDIVVINYDIAARHEEALRAVKWDLALVDEAHNLKEMEAKRTVAILGSIEDPDAVPALPLSKIGFMVMLTGTPKPNRIAELWNLLSATRPDLWGRGNVARQIFINRYEPPILIQRDVKSKFEGVSGRKIIVPMNGKPLREIELQLRLRGSGSFTRRMKRDTDMPQKFRTPIEMPFKLTKEDLETLRLADADMREIHQRMTGHEIMPGRTLPAREIIDAITGLKPGSPHFSEIARVRKNVGVLKAPHMARFLISELDEDADNEIENRQKSVFFAHHQEVIATVAERVREKYPDGVLVYDGKAGSAKKRQAIIDAFQEDPKKRLIIISLAGATGITLTAAYRMRVGEPDWSASNMIQIEDRIWRIGQEMPCDIGYLFVPNSLDVSIGLSLQNKMAIDERTINKISFAADRKKNAKRKIPNPHPSPVASGKSISDDAQAEFIY